MRANAAMLFCLTFFYDGDIIFFKALEDDTMKTKIVATIGSDSSHKDGSSYKGGITDLNGNEYKPAEISYEYLVREFCNNGVDIIRLNLSHIDVDQVKNVFIKIKRAISEWEKENRNRWVAVLADLPGPKIRFHLDRKLCFKVGDEFTVHFEKKVSEDRAATVYINDKPLKEAMEMFDKSSNQRRFTRSGTKKINRSFQDLLEQIGKRDQVRVVVGDGDVVMEADTSRFNRKEASLACKVITVNKPEIEGRKGFTLKGIHVDIPSFTDEDRKKLDKLIEAEYRGEEANNPAAAYIGLSFTQSEDDILRLQEHIEKKLVEVAGMDRSAARFKAPSIIAKIETELGWERRDYILDVADGIMVARGDLGLQMDIEEVPAIQKRLIRLCNKRGKPVITATEMLKSMTESIEPTRAEGTDVFNAILDGSDAVMTSEETAGGKYPFHAIRKMKQIAVQAESYFEMKYIENDELRRAANLQRFQEFLADDYARIEKNTRRIREILGLISDQMAASDEECEHLEWRRKLYQMKLGRSDEQPTTNRITQATCTMSEAEEVKYIIAATASGRTLRMISRLRPSPMIIGAAHDIINTRRLTVSYGVKPICVGAPANEEGTEEIFARCREIILDDPGLVPPPGKGDLVIFTAGTPLGKSGTTNLVTMRKL